MRIGVHLIEQWFTQTEWQGIKFSELGIRLEPNAPATPEFYSAFYQEMQIRFPTYHSLPTEWKRGKFETARELALVIPSGSRVLSCGAGIGYIEHVLVAQYGLTDLFLWDWAPNASFWVATGETQYVETLETHSEEQYDFVFLTQVLYGMSRQEAVEFLHTVRRLIKQNGELILINTSPNLKENTSNTSPKDGFRTFVYLCNRIFRGTLRRIKKFGRPQALEQGWGWQRDNDAIAQILHEAGYSNESFFPAANQSFVRARAASPSSK